VTKCAVKNCDDSSDFKNRSYSVRIVLRDGKKGLLLKEKKFCHLHMRAVSQFIDDMITGRVDVV